MRAQNLTIAVPDRGCDKNCPYCVSRMTGSLRSDEDLMRRNLPKVKRIARAAQVTSVLLTGKGEPSLNLPWVERLLEEFAEWPVELQTNGRRLAADQADGGTMADRLRAAGLNLVAFSLDRMEQFEKYDALFEALRQHSMLLRITLNITDQLPEALTFDEALRACQGRVHQFSLRQITIPNHVLLEEKSAAETAAWIRAHGAPALYARLVDEMKARATHLIRELPYGARVYDIDDIAVTYFDYCVQDTHAEDDVRSLIFQEDGHLYTSWNSKASALF